MNEKRNCFTNSVRMSDGKNILGDPGVKGVIVPNGNNIDTLA
jgi:hypothetical protein